MWKVEKIVSKGKYNYAVVRNHPNATKWGYVLEHRIVMENHLGRLLIPNEVVHHVNGDKKDNRIENLAVMLRIQHAKKHGLEQGAWWVRLYCPECGRIFHRPKNKTNLGGKPTKINFCSLHCSGVFYRRATLSGKTHEVERAISENILAVYKKYTADNSEQTV